MPDTQTTPLELLLGWTPVTRRDPWVDWENETYEAGETVVGYRPPDGSPIRPVDCDDMLTFLREQGWAGGEDKSLEIHLEWSNIRVELHWNNEARTDWGQTTLSVWYDEQPSLFAALEAACRAVTEGTG